MKRVSRSETSERASRAPQHVSNVLNQLLVGRGYGRVLGSARLKEVWDEVVGAEKARATSLGDIKRSVLHVFVANSLLLQEFTFEKPRLLQEMQTRLPEQNIRDIRFRVMSLP